MPDYKDFLSRRDIEYFFDVSKNRVGCGLMRPRINALKLVMMTAFFLISAPVIWWSE
jgi:hypothetical protein